MPDGNVRTVRQAIVTAVEGMGFTIGIAKESVFSFAARSGPSGWRSTLVNALEKFSSCSITGQKVKCCSASTTLPALYPPPQPSTTRIQCQRLITLMDPCVFSTSA